MNTRLGYPLIIIAAGLLLTACTSTPYTRYLSPTISGELLVDGEPVSDIPVLLSIRGGDEHCFSSLRQTATGANGQFHLAAARDQMSYTPLMTYYLDEWNVCIDIEGRRLKIYADNRYGMGSVGGSIYIRCQFSKGHYSASSCKLGR